MWNHLLFLSKMNNTKKLLSGSISSRRSLNYTQRSVLNKKAKQVSFCVAQSFEYFRAADSVSTATSPLLYYYGMLSLAKSLIVANQETVFLEDVNYHGLARRPKDTQISNYDNRPELWTIEKEYALTREDGVFPQLKELLTGSRYPDLSTFVLKDLLAVIPEISQMFEKYYGKESQVLYLYRFTERSKTPYEIQICIREKDEQKIFKRIPELKKDFTMHTGLLHDQARIFTSKNLTNFPEYMGLYHSVFGGRYVVGGLKYRIGDTRFSEYLPPALVDYIAVFILSECVRYKQDLWGEVIEGKKSGTLGLIQLYISVIKRRFPNLILNELFGEPFGYGSPARLV